MYVLYGHEKYWKYCSDCVKSLIFNPSHCMNDFLFFTTKRTKPNFSVVLFIFILWRKKNMFYQNKEKWKFAETINHFNWFLRFCFPFIQRNVPMLCFLAFSFLIIRKCFQFGFLFVFRVACNPPKNTCRRNWLCDSHGHNFREKLIASQFAHTSAKQLDLPNKNYG